ncbi:MAG: helix-turn-helix domain-containing protein [Candidatus Omnitrophica bacterium]|nr:helix-turn-helix domain-containing protein [Candidatus Omnitrophota bacterium]
MEKLWTTSEAAQYLGIAEVDVEQLVKEGKLTGYRLGGQFLRFRPSQVEGLKGKIKFRPNVAGKGRSAPSAPWAGRAREFVYFYDFYVVSALLLAVLVVYLIAAS